MIFRLIDAVENDTVYGYLEIHGVEKEVIQDKIYEIKNRFCDKAFNDWSIDDVMNEFPEEWDWKFHSNDEILEI